MKKITTLAILGASLIGLAACGGSSKSKVEETKPVTAKKAVENTELKEAPAINVTDTTNSEQQANGNLVDNAKTEKRKKYVEYFNSTNETSVNGMKDIEELANDPDKNFDVAILVAPGVNGEKTKEEVFDLLKQTLRPEFLNRIDETVLFQPLNYNEIGKIVQFQLRGINKMLESRNIILTATQEAIDFILKKGYDPAFGARPLKRVVQQEVLNKLSKEILAGNVKEGERVTVDCFDNKLVFRPAE